MLERLGKLPAGSGGPGPKTADQVEKVFQDAKITWETEGHQLNLKIKRLEMELQRSQDTVRSEIFQEMHSQYEPQLTEAKRERSRLEGEIQSLTRELAADRQRLNARIEQLEKAIPEGQDAARKHQDAAEDWDSERRRTKKHIAALEEQLKEAKEAAYKAQRANGRTSSAE